MKYQLRIGASSRRKFISYEDYVILSLREDNKATEFNWKIDSSVEEHRNISLYDLLDLEIPAKFKASFRAILRELANG